MFVDLEADSAKDTFRPKRFSNLYYTEYGHEYSPSYYLYGYGILECQGIITLVMMQAVGCSGVWYTEDTKSSFRRERMLNVTKEQSLDNLWLAQTLFDLGAVQFGNFTVSESA